MNQRRVVVTGTGVLTNLASQRQELHQAIHQGKNELGPAQKLNHADLEGPLVGEMASFDPRDFLDEKNFRPLNRTALLLTSAAQLALDDSGWNLGMRNEKPVGLVVGTTFCSISTISRFDCRALTDGPKYTSPLDFANTVINAAAGQCAIWHNLRGVNSTVSSGAASSLDALTQAAGLIRTGHEDAVLAGGVEELCVESLLAFQRAGLLWKVSEVSTPIPFQTQKGFALAEGAGLLMLEDLESATNRGATILAEIKGSGSSFCFSTLDDSPTHGWPNGVSRAIKQAIGNAGLEVTDINAISSSANGYGITDGHEWEGIAKTFEHASASIPVGTPKVSTGELMGASGAMQAIDVVGSIEHCIWPQKPGAFVGQRSETQTVGAHRMVDNYLISSVSLDGNCSALVVSRV